ncbi:hypothetical protein CGZ80_17430 [Rhodopirellula sp. MGV]|nr:hypothetical protein CGZ80_17430 [Rhodopirellula sp. MGV]PNY33533.1 hypothetical protein C2E31_28005 [Rhodopirellula baltica]
MASQLRRIPLSLSKSDCENKPLGSLDSDPVRVANSTDCRSLRFDTEKPTQVRYYGRYAKMPNKGAATAPDRRQPESY